MRECSLGRAKAVLAVLWKGAPQLAHKTEMRTKSRNTAEDKLAELQQKYALLEDDRKAHYERWINEKKPAIEAAEYVREKNGIACASADINKAWAKFPEASGHGSSDGDNWDVSRNMDR